VLTHLSDATAEEVRALVYAGRHQQPTVAATLDDKLLWPAVALLLQVLSTRLRSHSKQGTETNSSRQPSQLYLVAHWGIMSSCIGGTTCKQGIKYDHQRRKVA